MTQSASNCKIGFIRLLEAINNENVRAQEQIQSIGNAQRQKQDACAHIAHGFPWKRQDLTEIANESNTHDDQIAV